MTSSFEPTGDMIKFLDDLAKNPQANMYSESMLLKGAFPGLSFEESQKAVRVWKERRENDVLQSKRSGK